MLQEDFRDKLNWKGEEHRGSSWIEKVKNTVMWCGDQVESSWWTFSKVELMKEDKEEYGHTISRSGQVSTRMGNARDWQKTDRSWKKTSKIFPEHSSVTKTQHWWCWWWPNLIFSFRILILKYLHRYLLYVYPYPWIILKFRCQDLERIRIIEKYSSYKFSKLEVCSWHFKLT